MHCTESARYWVYLYFKLECLWDYWAGHGGDWWRKAIDQQVGPPGASLMPIILLGSRNCPPLSWSALHVSFWSMWLLGETAQNSFPSPSLSFPFQNGHPATQACRQAPARPATTAGNGQSPLCSLETTNSTCLWFGNTNVRNSAPWLAQCTLPATIQEASLYIQVKLFLSV